MKAFTDKLLDFTEHYADEIAERWCKAMHENPKTPSYHSLPEEKCLPQAVSFYANLKKMYHSDDPYQEALLYFTEFAEGMYAEAVPLHEAVYAIVMLRRHMWLYAEFQALFMTTLDMHQAVDSINRTILLSDYGTYIVTQKYAELAK